VTQTNDEIRRQIVTFLQQSADLKVQAQELLQTAYELRQKAETLRDAIEKTGAEGNAGNEKCFQCGQPIGADGDYRRAIVTRDGKAPPSPTASPSAIDYTLFAPLCPKYLTEHDERNSPLPPAQIASTMLHNDRI
jgi:hypothetical protein